MPTRVRNRGDQGSNGVKRGSVGEGGAGVGRVRLVSVVRAQRTVSVVG